MRIYPALVLNDQMFHHYATEVKAGIKTIETRMKTFSFRGDFVVCCGNKSTTSNRGKALCIVNLYDTEPMKPEHEPFARIECVPGRISHFLKDWRHFSYDFEFTRRYVSGSWQGWFKIYIPDHVEIIPQPQIKSYHELLQVPG